MFIFPKTLPSSLTEAFAGVAGCVSPEEALPEICTAVIKLFEAKEGIVYFRKSPLTFSDQEVIKFCPAPGLQEGLEQRVIAAWLESGTNELICRDLQARSAAVSFSAFSWPYVQAHFEHEGLKERSFPREYTILLPFSSAMALRDESESSFFGYLGLFFDSFPMLSDTTVQLIITLPELLSSLVAGYLRHYLVTKAADLSVFCHDMKRYLLVARECMHTLKADDKEQRKKAFAALERSLLRMLHQSNSLLLSDKDEHGNLKISCMAVNLNELILETTEEFLPLFAHSQIKVNTELRALPAISLDPAIFPSVLNNLLDNALKYSKPGSAVTIKTRMDGNNRALIEFSDTGQPIPAEEQGRVFQKRFRGSNTRGKSGNGLGLYLVRKIVESHGGEIRLTQENSSKTFVISLPAPQ